MTASQEGRRDFVKYSFFKVAPEWRRLPPGERSHSKREFCEVVAEWSDRVTMASYSLVGTRGDVDFALWKISHDLEPINELMARINHTELGKIPGGAPFLPGDDPPLTLRGHSPTRRPGRYV